MSPPHIIQPTHANLSTSCTGTCDNGESLLITLHCRSEKRCSGRRDGLYTHSGVSTPRSTQPADSALFRTCLLLWDTPGASSWRIVRPKPA
ncbi:uncharacterized protein LOC144917623 isoform X2 [Branchiostoma floridae x Branchiostoma belcheri]